MERSEESEHSTHQIAAEQALGVKRGVPDLLMPVLSGSIPGLAFEFKSATGRVSPDEEQ